MAEVLPPGDDDDYDGTDESSLYPSSVLDKKEEETRLEPEYSYTTPTEIKPHQTVDAVGYENIIPETQISRRVAVEMTKVLQGLKLNPSTVAVDDVILYIERLIGLRHLIIEKPFIPLRDPYWSYEADPPNKHYKYEAAQEINFEICNRTLDLSRRVLAESLRKESRWISGELVEDVRERKQLLDHMMRVQDLLDVCRGVLQSWTTLGKAHLSRLAVARALVKDHMGYNKAYRLWAKGWTNMKKGKAPNIDTAERVNYLKIAAEAFHTCYVTQQGLSPQLDLTQESERPVVPLINHCLDELKTRIPEEEHGRIPAVALQGWKHVKMVSSLVWTELSAVQWLIAAGDYCWYVPEQELRGVAISLWVLAVKNKGVVPDLRDRMKENAHSSKARPMVSLPLNQCVLEKSDVYEPDQHSVSVIECVKKLSGD